jgi:hypothetical protein
LQVTWFAKRSDLVVLLFDAHKLVIEQDFLEVIQAVVGATQGQQSRKVGGHLLKEAPCIAELAQP